MKELEQLCKDQDLSFMLMYNNHKRYGLSVREYAKEFMTPGFDDEEGQRWLAAMERRDSMVCISVCDRKSMAARFANYDVNIASCVTDTIQSIKDGVRLKEGEKGVDYTLAPVD